MYGDFVLSGYGAFCTAFISQFHTNVQVMAIATYGPVQLAKLLWSCCGRAFKCFHAIIHFIFANQGCAITTKPNSIIDVATLFRCHTCVISRTTDRSC